MLTGRLDLRAISLTDLKALHHIRASPEYSAYIPTDPDRDMDSTRSWIERFGAQWNTHGVGYWTVRLRASGQVIGVGGVDRRREFWNLYYVIDSEHWGRGYATELARAAERTANALDPGLPLVAWIDTENVASQSVARHLGLNDYGLLEREHWKGRPMHYWADRPPADSGAAGRR